MDKIDAIFGTGAAAETPADTSSVSTAPAQPSVAERGEGPRTPMASLACFVMARFKENEDARQRSGVTDRLLYCQRANRCLFSEEQRQKLAEVFGRETIDRLFVPVTATKIRAARSLLVDLTNQSGDPLFRIEPSPSPTLPEEVSSSAVEAVTADIRAALGELEAAGVTELPPQAIEKIRQLVAGVTEDRYDAIMNRLDAVARTRAERMQRKVWDVMVEGGFREAFVKYIDSICTYGTGLVIGPVMRRVAKNTVSTNKTGVPVYRRQVKAIPCYESVDPQDCYPAPDAKEIGDGALCIVTRYMADDLWRLSSADGDRPGDGWIAGVVEEILRRHPRGGVRIDVKNYDTERRYCENNGFQDTADCAFEGVRCFASVRGSELLDMGITRTARFRRIEEAAYYKTETVVIENRVVYCRIYPDEADLPVSKGVFYTLVGSWWGEGVADKVAMCQCVLNNCIKALLQNMAVSSSAIFWVKDVQRLANKAPNALRLKAGMTVPFLTSMTGDAGAPIGALSVPSTANELLAIWNSVQNQADIDSGVPRYAEGQSAGQSGALRTSSGLAQFSEHMMRCMKMVMTTTDQGVIGPVARKTADWVLLNDDDMDLKGDVEIVPVGLVGKVMKVQRDSARLQLLQLVLNSQLMTQAIGVQGVMTMFRPSLAEIDINPDEVVPSKAKMDAMEAVAGIKQVFEATQASAGIQAAAQQQGDQAPQNGGGAPGIARPEPLPGSVAERRSVA